MGQNFDDYPGFQPMRSWANTYVEFSLNEVSKYSSYTYYRRKQYGIFIVMVFCFQNCSNHSVNCSSDWEKLLKLKAEKCIQSVKDKNNFWNRISVIQIVKNTWDLATCRKVRKTNFHSYSETAQLNWHYSPFMLVKPIHSDKMYVLHVAK